MKTYEFDIILAGQNDLHDELLHKLFEAGCDDASPSSCAGQTTVSFDREAESFHSAVQSAIDNIQAAGFRVARIETDESRTVTELNESFAAG